MSDMLVKLYDLAPIAPLIMRQSEKGIVIRRAIPPEKHHTLAWVKRHFDDIWVSEVDIAYTRLPPSCFVAIQDEKLIGFACYDTVRRGFFGPTGVAEVLRGQGIGKALLFACLHDMWAQGYGYAIIAAAGPIGFYQKACAATIIPNSRPGVFGGMLQTSE